MLGLGVLKVALHRSKGTPFPEEWQGLENERGSVSGWLHAERSHVAPLAEFPPGS